MITRIIENLTGARLTVTYVRIGGLKHDLPQDFAERVTSTFKVIRKLLNDCDRLLSRNRIFIDRMSNIGLISRDTAINYSLTGPILRATGVNYDVRKAYPYLVYDKMQFDVPLGAGAAVSLETPLGHVSADATSGEARVVLSLNPEMQRERPQFFYYADGAIASLGQPR